MTRKSTREIHFDILRILAMVLVMLFHYTAQFSNSVEPTTFFVLMKLRIDYGVNCNIAVILTFFVVAVLASMHFYMTKFMNQRLERKS